LRYGSGELKRSNRDRTSAASERAAFLAELFGPSGSLAERANPRAKKVVFS